MKRFLAVLFCALVFSAAMQTACAVEYDITDFQGENGLLGFTHPMFASGDVLNIRNDITSIEPGGPIWTLYGTSITIKGNGHTIKGYSDQYNGNYGFIMKEDFSPVAGPAADYEFTIENAVITNFKQNQTGVVVIEQTGGILNLIDTSIIDNSFVMPDFIGEITAAVELYAVEGFIKAINKDVLFSGNTGKDMNGNDVKRDIYMSKSNLYLLPSAGKTISLMEGIGGNGALQVGNLDAFNPNEPIGNYTGTLVLGGNNESFGVTDADNISVFGATVKLLANATYFNGLANNSYANGTLDIQNGVLDYISMNNLTVFEGTKMNMKIDVDLLSTEGDYIISGSFEGSGTPVIQNINLLSETEEETVYVAVLGGSQLQQAAVLDPSAQVVDGKIYSYNVTLINENDPTAPTAPTENPYLGSLKFTRGLFNAPAIGASYAVQGVRLLQEELAYVLFENVGNFSFFEKAGASAGDIPRDNPTMWLKAFAVDSELDFGKYGKADADYYGAMGGLDFDRLYKGFDAAYGFFGSYISGKQKGSISTTEQSGGYAGGKATFYFGKLFFSGVLDAGLLNNSLETTAGTDEFKSNVYAATLKGGYNFELLKRSFTLQPNITAGFSHIDTEDYTNSLGVKIETDDVSLFTLMPGVKLAKNLGKCWILSADGHYVYSSVNGDLKADSIILPDNEYDNYFRYSACIEKIWGYTVAHLRAGRSDGGRSGWNLSAGIEWKF